MKKILVVILFWAAAINANSQTATNPPTLSTDSLSTIIRALQNQISVAQSNILFLQHQVVVLQNQAKTFMVYRTVTFDPLYMSVSNNPDSLNKFVTIKPAIFNSNTGILLAQKDSALISSLQLKVAGLKVTSTIQ